jgi:hypothetical protein
VIRVDRGSEDWSANWSSRTCLTKGVCAARETKTKARITQVQSQRYPHRRTTTGGLREGREGVRQNRQQLAKFLQQSQVIILMLRTPQEKLKKCVDCCRISVADDLQDWTAP